ncbi:MAG: SPOR domain-containing protein [Bacteroidaceae bacterium]|nr:SPOR domain-containing protein [Bacteroidaceae bacterium]
MKRLSVLLLMLASLPIMAQENIVDRLLQVVPDQGVISIHQDSRLEALLGVTYDPSKSKGKKIQTVGYRIQIYAGGNTRYAKEEAQKAAQYIREKYPEIPVYTEFVAPRWVCRVGDYKTIEEADQAMRILKQSRHFKEIAILPNQLINITL